MKRPKLLSIRVNDSIITYSPASKKEYDALLEIDESEELFLVSHERQLRKLGYFDEAKGGPGSGGARPGAGRPRGAGWSAMMSKEQAEEYTKDSVYQKTVYHGTKSDNTAGIDEEGLKPSLEPGFYGHGVYLSDDQTLAASYGKTQYEAKVRLENPAEFSSLAEFNSSYDEYALKHGYKDDSRDSFEAFSNSLVAKHDGIIVSNKDENFDVVTVFSKQNIALYKKHEN